MATRRHHLRTGAAAAATQTRGWWTRRDEGGERTGASLDVHGRRSLEVRNSVSFLLFGDGNVGGGDDERSPKPDRSEAGLRPRRRETDCTRRITPTCRQNTTTHRYDTICCIYRRSKADVRQQLNLPHGPENKNRLAATLRGSRPPQKP